ncbi:Sucrose synthase [Sterolibacterium denitrificans]|uniref:Sucrose synthase n=1 Tax=Sterolibacterium denitrificans TaxID=157592 RepID=A0A7Z7HQ34_9PROT|nr:sucrose synthase [Sterolibacterium denitrificans]SMB24185.1 Sucrose synthase [Sterolibacterium denitrificans]
MIESLCAWTTQNRDAMQAFLRSCFADGRSLLLHTDLQEHYQASVADKGNPLAQAVRHMQEAVLRPPQACFAIREHAGHWHYLRQHLDTLLPECIDASEYLHFKERLVVDECTANDMLEVDFGPFNREFPRLQEIRSIGQGMSFLNRHLASAMFQNPAEGQARLIDFLHVHALAGQQLMLFDFLQGVPALRAALREAQALLQRQPAETPWNELAEPMGRLGFAPGWGDTAQRMTETMSLLIDLLEAPSPQTLETFLARIPMVSRLLILSPHGWFAQDGVLGRPDTGGQVVYILDQVRALEQEMRHRLAVQGVNVEPRILVVTRLIPEADGTTCDQALERIHGCEHAVILRVPFRHPGGEVLRHWISRFDIWPYLEDFAVDVEHAALAELGGRPDLIVGNYSDGNLVASLLSQRLGVTQCNIAHALEQSKYLHSALYWRDNDGSHHFACQYTADLIAMNSADFVITSTLQEIAGTHETVGQYESYQAWTLPGLYRVVRGIDPFDPRFNIVSPGADAEVFFPYHDAERRLHSLRPQIDRLLFASDPGVPWRGGFSNPDKPLLFTLARLDRIKNLSGLVDWFGNEPRLRQAANLLIIGGHTDPAASSDAEEKEQIQRMHDLMDQHQLDGQMRWLGARLDKALTGEIYRVIADCRGIFVQPALFEAFGLTLIEAMASGLPVFATRHGGPLEIIEHGISGFHIDPGQGGKAATAMADFLERCSSDPEYWRSISSAALTRVAARYTWRLYAERMMTLTRIYGFWKFVSKLEREETARYLQMFHHLQLRPLARAITT